MLNFSESQETTNIAKRSSESWDSISEYPVEQGEQTFILQQ